MYLLTQLAQSTCDASMTASQCADQASRPSDLAIGSFGLIFVMFMIIWLIMFALGVVGFIFWIMSLIHVIQHEDVPDRTMWLLLVIFLGPIAAVIYFYTIKKKYDLEHPVHVAPVQHKQ